GDLVDRVDRTALAEDRVTPVEVHRGPVHDEELRAVRVRPAVRHAERARVIVRSVLPDLVGDDVAGLTRAEAWHIARGAGRFEARVAALDHEALNDAVEERSIVRRRLVVPPLRVLPRTVAAREADEVRDRDRRLVVEELAVEAPHIGLDRGAQRLASGEPLR